MTFYNTTVVYLKGSERVSQQGAARGSLAMSLTT